jgi:hypothetical protein
VSALAVNPPQSYRFGMAHSKGFQGLLAQLSFGGWLNLQLRLRACRNSSAQASARAAWPDWLWVRGGKSLRMRRGAARLAKQPATTS